MPAIPRSLAAAAAATVLAAVLTACQETAPNPQPVPVPPTTAEDTGTSDTDPSDAGTSDTGTSSDRLFLGESAHQSRPTLRVPTTPVGEAAVRHFALYNPDNAPKTVEEVSATTDTGETDLAEDNCSGVELPPQGSCTVTVRHVASEPGAYTGQLTAATSDSEVFTADITGEATGGETTDGTEEPPDPSPTADATPTGDPSADVTD
ncbi:hypothetical protein SUDANB120_02256 [Streptomyces sp. enrichment culture]|uniref:hypothetical protein n=1 Tax=Streptomyces sp. enrichment culture TaxID=1795815 RepID=UPI003F57DCBB